MGLEKLAQLGWYKAEPSSPREISDLFSIVDRAVADSEVEEISDDLRFQAAYNGILTVANVALRSSGFRVSPGTGHHQRVIESLEYTLPLKTKTHGSGGCARSNPIRRRGIAQATTRPVESHPAISRR